MKILLSLCISFNCIFSFGADSDSLKTITISAVGDIMIGTHFPSSSYLPHRAYGLMADVKHELLNADITFGNLEGCLLDKGAVVKKCKDTLKCYAFKMPEKYVDIISQCGFDLMSLANNHIYDFGVKGANRTAALLDSVGIIHSGLRHRPYEVLVKDDLRIGFISFSPNRGTLDINQYSVAIKLLNELNEKSDIVIVSFHGGAEGSSHQHVTGKNEVFYGENRGNVREFAHLMIDNGADLVLGHGPHVTRAIEVYKDRFIAYSMGNFCTYGRFNLRGPNGIAPLFKIEINSMGEFVSGEIVSVYQDSNGFVRMDPNKRVVKKIKQLNKIDIDQKNLVVGDNGEISYIR